MSALVRARARRAARPADAAVGAAAWVGALAALAGRGASRAPRAAGLGVRSAARGRRPPAGAAPAWAALGGARGCWRRAARRRRDRLRRRPAGAARSDDPVASLAADARRSSSSWVVTSDPRPVPGRFADQCGRAGAGGAGGVARRGVRRRVPVVVLTTDDWSAVRLGERVAVRTTVAERRPRRRRACYGPSSRRPAGRRAVVARRGHGASLPAAFRRRRARPTSGRWCRPWSTATTPGSTRPSRTTSGRPG